MFEQLLRIVEEEDIFKPASDSDVTARKAVVKAQKDEEARQERNRRAAEERARLAREAERERQRAEFKTKSHEVLKALGMTKIRDNPYNWSTDSITIGTNDAGEELHMNWGGDNRIRVDGDYPKPKHRDDYHSTKGAANISLSGTKTVDQMTREIGRRFMPSYKEAFTTAQKSATQHDTYMDTTIAVLAALKGSKPDDYEIRNKKISKPYKSGGEARWDAVAYGSSVNMDIRYLTVDQAKRIAAISRERQPKVARESRGMFEHIFEASDDIFKPVSRKDIADRDKVADKMRRVGFCDNTDCGHSEPTDLRRVIMSDEFMEDGALAGDDVAYWCDDCIRRDGSMLVEAPDVQ